MVRDKDSFGIIYTTGYILSKVKIKREIKRERKERGKRERGRGKRERDRGKRNRDKKVCPKVKRLISRDLQNTNLETELLTAKVASFSSEKKGMKKHNFLCRFFTSIFTSPTKL